MASPQASSGSGNAAPDPDLNAPEFFVEKRTCLSTLPHNGKDVKDHLAHYFGCVEFRERETYFENEAIWQSNGNGLEKKCNAAASIFAQLKRICVLRKAIDADKHLKSTNADSNADSNTDSNTNSNTNSNSNSNTNSNPPKKKTSLVEDVDDSLKAWKNTEVYKKGIKQVRDWRNGNNSGNEQENSNETGHDSPNTEDTPTAYDHDSASQSNAREKLNALKEKIRNLEGFNDNANTSNEENNMEISDYNLERDVNAYIMKFQMEEDPKKHDEGPEKNGKGSEKNGKGSEKHDKGTENISFGLKGANVKHPDNVRGEFPDQRIPLSFLFENPKIIQREKSTTDVRYIHKPSNNMHWVEELIDRYYGEETKKDDESWKSHEDMLLRSQFWKGQQHGSGDDSIQARHMRPLSERVSSEYDMAEEMSNNVVLFMPYLHWETDRRREVVARLIEERVQQFQQKRKIYQAKEEEQRKINRRGLAVENIAEPLAKEDPRTNHMRDVGDVFQKVFKISQKKTGLAKNSQDHVEKRRELGQFLLNAARLYEAMSNYRDRQMINQFLFAEAPLHPRRTLDQSNFWTLNSTRARDRDQVIYRGTSMESNKVHKLVQNKKKGHQSFLNVIWPAATNNSSETEWHWTCEDDLEEGYFGNYGQALDIYRSGNTSPSSTLAPGRNGSNSRASGGSMTSQNTDEDDGTITSILRFFHIIESKKPKRRHFRCPECLENIRKVPRLIMVDQLWMWVLDENTIITSFPRRYGVNKSDESGVYKSIRTRLRGARKYQFRSVYDIALVILDECTNTFFDRTKINDELPQVIDIFSRAIGNATCKQTMSFDHVWHWTREASSMYRLRLDMVDINSVHDNLLDINPEGRIQREIKDIIEELDIMLLLQSRQVEIIKRFVRNVLAIMHPDPNSSVIQEVTSDSRSRRLLIKKKMSDAIKKKIRQYNWFLESSVELQADMADHIQEIQNLKNYAESTARSITDLMALKQQQASVAQAWQAVQQADETVKQGRAIMVFTLTTIIFLPLSFMSSIFGMNNSEFGDNGWALEKQLKLMFGISIGFTGFVMLFAYSNFIRTLLWSAGTLAYTMVFIWLRIYYVWLGIRDKWSTEKLGQRAARKVRREHEKVQRKRHEELRRKNMWHRTKPDDTPLLNSPNIV